MTHRTRTRTLPLGLTALAVGATTMVLLGNETVGPGGDGSSLAPQPGPLSDVVFGEVAVGEFTADLSKDAVVLCDGVPTLCSAPEVFRTAVRWDGGTGADPVANDLAVMPTSSGPDRLFVTASTGLHELVWDGATQSWDTVTIDSSTFAGAGALAVGDFDGDGELDLVAADDSETEVHILYGDGAGGFGSTPLTVETYMPALDVLAIDWDATDDPAPSVVDDELAIVTAAGVEVLQPDGSFEYVFNWTTSAIHCAVIDPAEDTNGDPTTGERLVMVLYSSTTNNWRVAVQHNQGGEYPTTSLGTHEPVSVTSVDLDSDGDMDLLYSLADDTAVGVHLAHSDPSVHTFQAGEVSLHVFGDQGRDPSLNQAGVAAIDFDHDGELEIFAPSQGEWTDADDPGTEPYSNVHIIDFDGSVEAGLLVGLEQINFAFDSGFSGPAHPVVDLTGPTTELSYDPATQSLRLLLVVWLAPGQWEPLDTTPLRVYDFALPGSGTTTLDLEDLTLGPDEDEVTSWVLRQVVRDDATGDVVACGPATIGVMAFGSAATHIAQVVPVEVTLNTTEIGGGSSTPEGSVVVGGSTPRSGEDDPPPEEPPSEEPPPSGS